MMVPFRYLACIAAMTTVCANAQAALTVYSGENQSPGGIVSGDPLTARTQFLSNLSGVGTETFEAQTVGDEAPIQLLFPGSGSSTIGATLAGVGVIFPTPSSAGRFNTTGATVTPTAGKWWSAEGSFSLTFNRAIAAFGFYGTDVGDFNGQLTISLTGTDNQVTNLNVNHTINGNDASLLFWGFVDTSKAYTKITFGNTATGFDFFGFDDMTVGDINQVKPPTTVPEPTTIALLALGLLGSAFAKRRRA